jgi:hypothetical protein
VDCAPWPLSSSDPTGPETFTEIPVAFEEHHYHDNLVGVGSGTDVQATQRVTPWNLRPVEQVLADLGYLG